MRDHEMTIKEFDKNLAEMPDEELVGMAERYIIDTERTSIEAYEYLGL